MRPLFHSLAAMAGLLLTSCAPSQSQTPSSDWADALADGGLAAAEDVLAAAPEDDAEAAFLRGGISALRAIEHVMQIRYANYSGALPILPGMGAELPSNPDGVFDPAFVEQAMSGALVHLAAAQTAITPAREGSFEVDIPLEALWLDIDQDGSRSDWEGLLVLGGQAPDGDAPTVRFDTADAEWLSAYIHFASALCELGLAVDPTPAVRRVMEGRTVLEDLGGIAPTPMVGDDDVVDTAAAFLLTMRGVPDATRTQAAHGHFVSMIDANRVFWAEVEAETDNVREWLPNASQESAFGLSVPAELAEGWQQILAEFEAVLAGEVLIPYWRVTAEPDEDGVGVGINVRRVLETPGDMDVILWIQGAGAAPFLERGRLADPSALDAFDQLAGRNAPLFAAWFN